MILAVRIIQKTSQVEIMRSNPVVHFEIYVQDMERARAFYEAMLGVQLRKAPAPGPDMEIEMWFFPVDPDAGMTQYGAGGALVRMPGCAPGSGGTVVYFGCEDCGVEAARAAQSGGTVSQEKMAIGEYGYCAMVIDTEGNLIGLHSMH
jgi:predicted enzyme related to lactoylglutathione lyase